MIGTITATDPDGDELTYRVVGSDRFTIRNDDATRGQLFRANNRLDFETAPTHTFTVEAADPDGNRDTITVAVNLTDVDEPPEAIDLELRPGATDGELRAVFNAPHTDGPPLTGYTLRHREVEAGAGGSWRPLDSWIEQTLTADQNSYDVTISGRAAVFYEVEVWASNDEGDGPPVALVSKAPPLEDLEDDPLVVNWLAPGARGAEGGPWEGSQFGGGTPAVIGAYLSRSIDRPLRLPFHWSYESLTLRREPGTPPADPSDYAGWEDLNWLTFPAGETYARAEAWAPTDGNVLDGKAAVYFQATGTHRGLPAGVVAGDQIRMGVLFEDLTRLSYSVEF